MPRPEHRAALIDTVIDDEVIVIPREVVLGLEMHLALLRSRADLVTAFNEATVLPSQSAPVQSMRLLSTDSLFLLCLASLYHRIMILANVKV